MNNLELRITNPHFEKALATDAGFALRVAKFEASEDARKRVLNRALTVMESRERRGGTGSVLARKYDRYYHGVGCVTAKLNHEIVRFKRQNGRELGDITFPKKAFENLRVGDHLVGTYGFRDNQWRIIGIIAIGSPMSPEHSLGLC